MPLWLVEPDSFKLQSAMDSSRGGSCTKVVNFLLEREMLTLVHLPYMIDVHGVRRNANGTAKSALGMPLASRTY